MTARSTVRRRAFESFFVEEMPVLYRAARRRVRNDADAEDLVQETMLRAYRSFDADAPPDNPAAWCHTILTNLITDRARAAQRTPDTMSVDDEGAGLYDRLEAGRETGMFSDPQRLVERWSNQTEVRAAMGTLPEWARDVLVLSHVRGLRYREIAKALGVPEGTVMSRLARARRALERALADRAGLPDRARARLEAPAPESAPRLDKMKQSWGTVPPAFAALAADPALLDAASRMMQSVVADGALSAAVKRALLASLAGSPPDPADRPLTALAGFVAAASADPAGLSRSDYELLYAEGWSEPQVMEALHLSAFAPYMSTMNAALGG